MKSANGINLTMLCDFYELTMGNGYLDAGMADRICYFDLFFRDVPDGGGFAIAAGLEQIVDYIQNLRFEPEDIEYLRSRGIFSEAFLDCLKNFRFAGHPGPAARDLHAVGIQPPEPDRHKGQPHLPRCRGPGRDGVRLTPRPGHRRRRRRRAGGLYRRLLRHGLHGLRPALRREGARHDGALLGADVPLGV